MVCQVFALVVLALLFEIAHSKPLVRQSHLSWGSYRRGARADEASPIELRIVLVQNNLDSAVKHLLAVSSPDSLEYGQYWTVEGLADFFAPTQHSIDQVRTWLNSSRVSGDSRDAIFVQDTGEIRLQSTVHDIETLLATTIYRYDDMELPQSLLGFDNYTLPNVVASHIDFITPAGIFRPSPKLRRRGSHAVRRQSPPSEQELIKNLPPTAVHPKVLRELYGIPSRNWSHESNSLGIFAPGVATWIADDLDTFFAQFQQTLRGSRPRVISITGGRRYTDFGDSDVFVEPNLDFEYAMALASPQPIVTLQVGATKDAGSLASMLAVYNTPRGRCALSGSDEDVTILDPFLPNSRSARRDCKTRTSLPNVISISYAWGEPDYPPEYLKRQCLEFLKLGLQGVTVVVSSGDSGPARHFDAKCTDPVTGLKNATRGNFIANWPAACPWVTVVGGTQLPVQTERIVAFRNRPSAGTAMPPAGQISNPVNEIETAYARHVDGRPRSSGGGFSNLIAAPGYQQDAVAAYLAGEQEHLATLAGRFNASGRAYPDVAALAAGYQVVSGGKTEWVYGTSASAPVFASIIASINDERAKAGNPPVGFVNPMLYKHPEAFNKIRSGANAGCGYEEAFRASGDWNPVTGLGSPNYEKLRDVFMSLP